MWERKRGSSLKRIDSLIGAGTIIQGDVTFTGGLRIDGRVDGNVIAAEGEPGTLVISAEARVEGEIRVSHVVINGTVNGPIAVGDHLELQPRARIVLHDAAPRVRARGRRAAGYPRHGHAGRADPRRLYEG